eukprot:TRINITY_DN10376_c1_g1_i1.p1 TRINITY_DN10376_c1_g1~~TRINITY_DN10376_c1_g1_i1.p1  ORF type:complete len:814 (-),score=134.77 TRINITY_DN10376_c1_g1_i1:154-2268(-)
MPSAKEVMESGLLQTLTLLLIVSNALVIGLETDLPDDFPWSIVENVFLIGFLSELLLRLKVYGWYFFSLFNNSDIIWNIFDFVVVTGGVVNSVLMVLESSELQSGQNATLLRLVRLLRILRVLRIIRIVRFLKQLYLLAYGFIEGTLAVFWVAILASFMLYTCSVILVRTYGKVDENDPHADFFNERFGTIPRCMFALFELISAPDLTDYKVTMFDNPPLVVFLIIFIVLGSFGINGLLVALINESILEKNQARIEQERYDREWKRKHIQQRCRDLFDNIDVNKNRVLPRTELMKFTDDIAKLCEEAGANFQQNDLDQMFYIMDQNDTGIIARWEFVQCVVELCDQIRPMSIMELNYQVSKCANKVEHCDVKVDTIVKFAEQCDLKIDFITNTLRDWRLEWSWESNQAKRPPTLRHSGPPQANILSPGDLPLSEPASPLCRRRPEDDVRLSDVAAGTPADSSSCAPTLCAADSAPSSNRATSSWSRKRGKPVAGETAADTAGTLLPSSARGSTSWSSGETPLSPNVRRLLAYHRRVLAEADKRIDDYLLKSTLPLAPATNSVAVHAAAVAAAAVEVREAEEAPIHRKRNVAFNGADADDAGGGSENLAGFTPIGQRRITPQNVSFEGLKLDCGYVDPACVYEILIRLQLANAQVLDSLLEQVPLVQRAPSRTTHVETPLSFQQDRPSLFSQDSHRPHYRDFNRG